MRRTTITVISLALAASPLAAGTAQAGETVAQSPTPPAKVAARGLLSPLSLHVKAGGTVWFSQNFAGQLMRKRPGKPARPMFSARPGTEVGAVSARGRTVTFAITSPTGRTVLKTWRRDQGVRRVAGLSRYETRNNPDAGTTYGFTDLDPECEAQVGDDFKPYTGIVESHPYATLTARGTTYVADAAANAILAVSGGTVETLAVLPTQPLTVPPGAAGGLGLPECVEGHQFHFEPVPTDVERGPDGMLYVSTLPGGPEDPSLGPRAAVHRVDPRTGDVTTVARGLLSATGLAVAGNGDVYVAELFRNRIARIPSGTDAPVRWWGAKMPGDVEVQGNRLWATRRVLTGLEGGRPAGQVVRYRGGVAR